MDKKQKKTLLIVLFVGTIVFIGFFAGIFLLVTNLMKGDAYKLSLEAINNNHHIVSVIGEPIEPGFFVSGSVSTSNSSGKADIEYSISGSKSTGNVYVSAYKKNDKWILDKVVVYLDSTGEQVNIPE